MPFAMLLVTVAGVRTNAIGLTLDTGSFGGASPVICRTTSTVLHANQAINANFSSWTITSSQKPSPWVRPFPKGLWFIPVRTRVAWSEGTGT